MVFATTRLQLIINDVLVLAFRKRKSGYLAYFGYIKNCIRKRFKILILADKLSLVIRIRYLINSDEMSILFYFKKTSVLLNRLSEHIIPN